MKPGILKRVASFVRNTPLHPQWLLVGNRDTARWVAGHAKGRTLDIGCADRWIERWLPPGTQYLGLDYYLTGKHLYHARPDVFGDAGLLPFADESVDTVLILEVVEHLRQPQDALREISRILRPQGGMLLSIPFLNPVHDAPHDYQRLTVHGIVRDVEASGMRVETVIPILGSIETAGLLACLAAGGTVMRLLENRSPLLLLAPIVLLMIPLINVVSWLSARLFPSWDALTVGYRLYATKP